MRVYIRGKAWDLQFTRQPKLNGIPVDGTCDAPDIPKKRICVKRSLRGRDLIETIIHEVIHAGCWDLNEEAVHELAADAARVLERVSRGRP